MTQLTDAQKKLLGTFKREMHVLVLAGVWCGDCSSQCPIFERFAELAPVIQLRYLDRDVHADVQQELKINGGNRVPVAVFFSEDGLEVFALWRADSCQISTTHARVFRRRLLDGSGQSRRPVAGAGDSGMARTV